MGAFIQGHKLCLWHLFGPLRPRDSVKNRVIYFLPSGLVVPLLACAASWLPGFERKLFEQERLWFGRDWCEHQS